MRRFLDWTQASGSGAGPSPGVVTMRKGSQQGLHQHQHQASQHSLATQMQHQSQQHHLISLGGCAGGGNNNNSNNNPSKELELQELTKLLHEIKYYQASSSPLPSSVGSQGQREFVEKINKTLPLFLDVFGTHIVNSLSNASQAPLQQQQQSNQHNHQHKQSQSSTSLTQYAADARSASQASLHDDCAHQGYSSSPSSKPSSPLPPSSPQMDKFPDLLPFAFTIARLFVSEVRQRASDKHAEDASLAILQFLSNYKHKQQQQQNVSTTTSSDTTTTTTSITSTDHSSGWDLLLALNTLANSQCPQIIQLLCDASLPSTLIKCLYLFFDLPVSVKLTQHHQVDDDKPAKKEEEEGEVVLEAEAVVPNQQEGGDTSGRVQQAAATVIEIPTRELTNASLIKAFTQLLVQLCSYQAGIDELIKRDDLRLLIGIASSQCAGHNRAWRKTAFLALLAISKNMHDSFMYLEQNICIQVYVENMHRINSLALATAEDLIDMIRVLLEFLYNLDVNNRNQPRCIEPLINQYKSSRILELIEDLLFTIDESIALENANASAAAAALSQDSPQPDPLTQPASQQPSVSSEVGVCIDDYRRYGKRLVHACVTMAKIYYSQESLLKNTSLKPLTMSRFEMFEQFKMPRPTSRDCILNNEATRFFKLAWSKCKDPYIIEAVLDSTIQLFNDDKYNYFIFESQQLLVYYMTSSNFKSLPCRMKQKLFKFLEFIIIETHYIPCLELGTLGSLLKAKHASDSERIMILRTLIACLRFNTKFSDIFREIGLLEVIIELLIETMQAQTFGQDSENLEVLYLIFEASQYLLAGPNNLNCTQFNESGAARHVFNCLSKPKFFHLFLPVHSSSSDEGSGGPNGGGGGGGGGIASHTSTPTPTSISRARHQYHALPIIHASNHWMEPSCRVQVMRPSIKQMQRVAFTIIRQLILSSAGDEHLANLLGLLARNVDDLRDIERQDSASGPTAAAAAAAASSSSDKPISQDEEVAARCADLAGDASQRQQSASCTSSGASQQRLDFAFVISQEVNLKIYILKSLMIILKDSHRCRALFRKVGGFIYIVSALVTIEKALPPYAVAEYDERSREAYARWRNVNGRKLWRLIKNCLMTIIVAMRSEPLNLRVFSDDVMARFIEAIRNLGCFNVSQKELQPAARVTAPPPPSRTDHFDSFKSIFLSPPTRDFSTISDESLAPNDACCQLFRFLYDMSLDMADGTLELETLLNEESGKMFRGHQHSSSQQQQQQDGGKSISFDHGSSPQSSSISGGDSSAIYRRRSHLQNASARLPSLDLNAFNPDSAILTFPCVILCILDLIPSSPNEDLMIFVSMIVKSLFKHERNQQLLCEAGMISKLLEPGWRVSITDKSHFLHDISEFMFVRLTKQAITARELRTFLRLGQPLCCQNLDEIEIEEEAIEEQKKSERDATSRRREKIASSRVETYVAMMTDERCKIQPPFVEFDMSSSNGCLSIFMPSIAPVNAKALPPNTSSFLNSTLNVHTNEKNGILGGVGSLERHFPPASGLTFSTWICVEKFPLRSSDANHNTRLLTIYRGSAATGKEYSCFKVQISALDRALTISTQETLLFDNEQRPDAAQHDPDCFVRIWTPETLLEGKWHHIAITLGRSAAKQSSIHVYVDGELIHNQRISYISPCVGPINSGALGLGGSSSSSPAAFVNAFIGSLPQIRMQSRARWKQGPCHLIEEPLSSSFISAIYSLGPNFIGNFQGSRGLKESSRSTGAKLRGSNGSATRATSESAHKHLMHQQSAFVGSPSSPRHGLPLSRVSSSGFAVASSSSQVSAAYGQHASSQGSQQALIVGEDRLLVNLDARSTSLITLSRMRRIYTRFDCRQVSRFLGLAVHENSTPLMLLHNTAIHLNGSSRTIGAVTIGHDHVRFFVPSPTEQTLVSVGGCYVLIGFVAQAQSTNALYVSLKALARALGCNSKLQNQMDTINGYQILTVMLWKKKHLLNQEILNLIFSLIVADADEHRTMTTTTLSKMALETGAHRVRTIQQVGALRDLVCECFDLWLQTDMINVVLEFIYALISSSSHEQQLTGCGGGGGGGDTSTSSTRARNLKYLRDMDLLPRMLRLLPRNPQINAAAAAAADTGACVASQDESNESRANRTFDAKAIYLIKQTVFELLNRTPRQSDILYFGQFLASLLPSGKEERHPQTISLRNVLLKSTLQMMTRNQQKEVNSAMQEELVRILGFDWFMLFIHSERLDAETITLGFLNLMIILSNDDLYGNFKSSSTATNGGWLKEPIFPTIDGKFNIQMLGINVGVFFGLGGKRKAICHDVLSAPNFFLLGTCLKSLRKMPRVYLMIFQTMIGRLSQLDASVLDSIGSFEKLNLDVLCDCLIGETHHKRRQTLAGIKFRCLELMVSLVYMIGDIMCDTSPQSDEDDTKDVTRAATPTTTPDDQLTSAAVYNFPTDIIRFFMYLYNNNMEFQNYCRRSEELIDALSETLMRHPDHRHQMSSSTSLATSSPNGQANSNGGGCNQRQMTQHPAAKEVLELSRLIILDRMTELSSAAGGGESAELSTHEQLHAFERFLSALAQCKDAQGELVDYILRQILLIIDSTARHNSIKTIGGSENVQQFQLLLVNSITVAQVVTGKIWSGELYVDNLTRVSCVIDHLLCLTEQIYKFNELLPKHQPPYAFVMQRVLNRILLFALSRPVQHISDRMLLLDLLKKIFDNRPIIILNHMHSAHSAEFFVCLTYCLMNIMEENASSPVKRRNQPTDQQQQPAASLIERQYGHPSPVRGGMSEGPSSSALLTLSMAKKLWDALYQSKKGILSEAFDISLSLPAFTLDTSPDLMQLKPDINETCERYWFALVERESKPRKPRLQPKQGESAQGGPTTSSAVNILSGRLTRVVNAASFVSRVVGATAGSMASNVNMVGEKLAQNRANRRDMMTPQRSPSDLSSSSVSGAHRGLEHQGSSSASGNSNLSAGGGGNFAGNDQTSPSSSHNRSQSSSDLFKHATLGQQQIHSANRTHISIIEEFIKSQTSQKDHKLALHKYLCDEWLDVEYEILLRERALFGPDYGSKLDKWCLDLTEGPRRMRKKMVNNTRQFYENYAYRSEHYNPENKSLRYRPPMSYDSQMYYLKTLNIDKCLLDTQDDEKSTTIEEITSDVKVVTAATSEAKSSTELHLELQKQASPSEEALAREAAGTPTNEPISNGAAGTEAAAAAPTINVDTAQSATPVKSVRGAHSSSLESLSSMAHIRRCSSSSPRPSEGDADDGDSTSFVDFSPEIEAETANSERESENIDSLSVLRLLEKNERISHMFRCSRVQGLDTFEGLLLFGKEHFYLIDGFTLLKTREVRDIDSLPADAHDPIIPNSTPNILAHSKKTCAKFSFDSVHEVHKRRYLLQPIALEVFSSDGRNALIVFPRNIRNKVYSRLMQLATQITSNAQESLAGQKSNVSVEGGSGLLSNLMGETSVTQRWVRGELSNFQYLMNLNTIAGRSYNDLMQYPIFPWILADYTSDCLDLSKASTFRDLSRPIGAQTSERLEQFKRRFAEWDDNETPPYHYGTFYSSAMIVASYMVRMEPFTQHFLRLQGGHFDLADRMFHSINDSWMSASKHNMADIKELIPEFFYLPEFLKNENKYDLGIKQNGKKLNDVILPPWAKGDAREFIRLHRSALESDYVSAHLHEWIDLIFGCKQQGQAAIDAVNVFHHLFYEGNVDIYNTDIDPIKKNAVIGFINNFGQVPKQLFKKAHPVRKVTNSSSNYMGGPGPLPLTPILPSLSGSGSSSALSPGGMSRALTHCPQLLRLINNANNIKDLMGPVGQIVQVDKNIVAVEQNKLLIPPEYCRYVAWGHADRSLRLGLYDSDRPIYVWEGSDNLQPNEILCCTIPNSRTMITAGTGSLITVWKIEKMRSFAPIANLYGHVEPVICLASSQSYSIIVSGSRDRTAIIWDLNRLTFVRQLGGKPAENLFHHGPISAIAINESTGDIATCATSWLYLWTINGELLAQVDSFSVVMQQSMGLGASMSSNLSQLHLLSVCFSQLEEWDLDEVIITGASDGSVAIWSMRYFQCPMTRAQIEQQQQQQQAASKIEADEKDENGEQASNATINKGEDQEQVSTNGAEPGSGVEMSAASTTKATTTTNDTDRQMDSIEAHDSLDSVPLLEQHCPNPNSANASEPIAIRTGHRRRTDTMNSEWVRLSTSSQSTIETIPMLKNSRGEGTPTSPAADCLDEVCASVDFLTSGDSYTDQGDSLLIARDQQQQPTCSTPKRGDSNNDGGGGSSSAIDKVSGASITRSCLDRLVDHSSVSNVSSAINSNTVHSQSTSKNNLYLTPNDPSLIKFSKSDTSLVDSFVLLDDASSPNRLSGASDGRGGPQVRAQSSAEERSPHPKQSRKKLSNQRRLDNQVRTSLKLLPNHYWRRELYLRIVLARRQGKLAPAAVTSLTISKDHKSVYIGDSAGKITTWSTV